MENRPHHINLMSFFDEITSLIDKDNCRDATHLEFGESQNSAEHNMLIIKKIMKHLQKRGCLQHDMVAGQPQSTVAKLQQSDMQESTSENMKLIMESMCIIQQFGALTIHFKSAKCKDSQLSMRNVGCTCSKDYMESSELGKS